jgi:hypothetical protein
VLTIDGRPIDDLPAFMEALYLHRVDEVLKIDALRGEKEFSVVVPVMVHYDKADDLTDVPDLQRSFIAELSIFVTDTDERLKPCCKTTATIQGS